LGKEGRKGKKTRRKTWRKRGENGGTSIFEL